MSGGASLRQEEGRMNFAHADPNLFSIFILHTDDSDDLPFSFIHMFGLAFSLLVRIHFLLIREGVARMIVSPTCRSSTTTALID